MRCFESDHPAFPTPLPQPIPLPRRIGISDVATIENAVNDLRALDHSNGGGACRLAVRRQLTQARLMLAEVTEDDVLSRLCVVLADLHNLAGWTSFDLGLVTGAQHHFGRALDLARASHADDLMANVHYRRGRVHLHHDSPAEALLEFTTGRLPAIRARSPLALAILSANQAWAHARMGQRNEALALLGQAEDEFAASEKDTVAPWAAFFDANDLTAMIGIVHTELAQTVDSSFARTAIPAVTAAIDSYGDDMARSRAFTVIALAVDHLIDGDADAGLAAGRQALEACSGVQSERTKDRMRPLLDQLELYHRDADARELAEDVAAFVHADRGTGTSSGG